MNIEQTSPPAAYAVFAENGNIRIWWSHPLTDHAREQVAREGWELVPLYRRPSSPPAEPISASDWADKVNFVKQQTAQAMDAVRPYVRCRCQQKLQMHHAYRCLYCGEWYCKPCAEVHFGKTVEHYRREPPIEGVT